MLGIAEIGSYIPQRTISNYTKKEKFGLTDEFIKEKLGVEYITVKENNENTSDLCLKAFDNLTKKIDLNLDEIEILVVITQNPDYTIPQTSGILHGKLNLNSSCAAFDISLGCSGFVYGWSVIQSFMIASGMKKGLLFTCDPYSKIINPDDKNTSLLFGDAATATFITEDPIFTSIDFSYGTVGSSYKELLCENNELYMNGRGVSNFAAKTVPKDISELLGKNNMKTDDIDMFLFHQGSKFIVSNFTKKLSLDSSKVVFDIYKYGNTVSSSLPILLEKQIPNKENKLLLASGFGVGLSWANVIIKRQ